MLKHVGRMANNQRKVIVAYKVVPGEPDNAIVVTTENLDAGDHDALIKLVESPAGQEAEDLATAMARTRLPDGRNMLAAFNAQGKMVKAATNTVEMTPNSNTSVMLNEINEAIASQRGVTVADLAVQPENENVQRAEPVEAIDEPAQAYAQSTPTTDGVLTDEDLAAQYRSQADSMFKEAKRLREQAEELVPTKKKASKKVEEGA
jgi:hypothetical protein